jgi:hypothetical protein
MKQLQQPQQQPQPRINPLVVLFPAAAKNLVLKWSKSQRIRSL